MNDVLMTPGHYFQIRIVLNSVSSLYRLFSWTVIKREKYNMKCKRY